MEQSSTPETQELLNKVDALIAEAAAVVASMQRDNAALSEQIDALSDGTVNLEQIVEEALQNVTDAEQAEDIDTLKGLAELEDTPKIN
jgi:conjugal transfer/entry exclusion protein